MSQGACPEAEFGPAVRIINDPLRGFTSAQSSVRSSVHLISVNHRLIKHQAACGIQRVN